MRNDRAALVCPRCHHSRFVVKYEASVWNNAASLEELQAAINNYNK